MENFKKPLKEFKEFLLQSLDEIKIKIENLQETFDTMPEESFLDELKRLNSLFSVLEIELVMRERNNVK